MESLVEKFKSRIASIDRQPIEPEQPPKVVKLFNIFKRSLPVAYNKLAFQNVTEEDVNLLFPNILKSKELPNGTVVYWDAVEVGTTNSWNVYSNEGIDTTDLGLGNININTYREGTTDVDWKG